MTDPNKNALQYKNEKASQGDLVTTHDGRAINAENRTTIRCQLYKSQLWALVQLVKAKGGDPKGRTYQWILQVLIDSLIVQHQKSGDVETLTNEEAALKLRDFKNDCKPTGISIESLEEVKIIEQETSSTSKAHHEFGEDLARAAQEQDLEGIGDLFDLEGFE